MARDYTGRPFSPFLLRKGRLDGQGPQAPNLDEWKSTEGCLLVWRDGIEAEGRDAVRGPVYESPVRRQPDAHFRRVRHVFDDPASQCVATAASFHGNCQGVHRTAVPR